MPSKKQARRAQRQTSLAEATARRDAAQAQLALLDANKLERKLAIEQYMAGTAIEVSTIPNLVQMTDWLAPEIRRSIGPAGTALGAVLHTNLHDREFGDDRPYLTNEIDNAEVRGIARYLCKFDITAVGVIGQLEDAVIGEGMTHTVKAEQSCEDDVPRDLIAEIQKVVNEFRAINQINCELETELFRRSRRDGDLFLRFYCRDEGSVLQRIVEPDQISEPGYAPYKGAEFVERYGVYCSDFTNWKYGVHKDGRDANRIFGYCTRWTDTEWEYVPASKMLHFKENEDRVVALGRSDFTPAWEWLISCSTLLRNMGAGTADRSSLSYITKYESADATAVKSMLSASGATPEDIAQFGSHYVTILKNGGKKLHMPKGMNIELPNFGSDGHEGFINVNKHMLRIMAIRWRMTEGQVTGDDSNNNRASSEEAGSKFHRYAKISQARHGERLAQADWKAVEHACLCGRFKRWGVTAPRQLYGFIKIEVTGPQIEVRDPLAQAQADQIDIETGVKTVADVQQERGMIVRKKSDGTGVDKSLTKDQSDLLKEYIDLVVTSGVPVEAARAMAAIGLPDVDSDALDAVFRPLHAVQSAGGGSGEFGDKNLVQQNRNRKSIMKMLEEFKSGGMNEAQARTMLSTTGLSQIKIDALIADASDPQLVQQDLQDAVESAVRELYRSDVVAEARGLTYAIEFNPNHVKSGPNGGQFTSSSSTGGAAASAAAKVIKGAKPKRDSMTKEKAIKLLKLTPGKSDEHYADYAVNFLNTMGDRTPLRYQVAAKTLMDLNPKYQKHTPLNSSKDVAAVVAPVVEKNPMTKERAIKLLKLTPGKSDQHYAWHAEQFEKHATSRMPLRYLVAATFLRNLVKKAT